MIRILVTIGPSSLTENVLKEIDKERVYLFRINMSHTAIDKIEDAIKTIKNASDTPICIDSEGAQLRNNYMEYENVIFKKDYHPFIVDWENFSNKKMLWGFDLSYFLISTVASPSIFHKDDEIKNTELLLLEKLWKKAFKNKNFKYLNKPVNYLKSKFGKTFIFRNYFDYYPNLLSKKKIDQLNEALKLKI